MNVPFTQVFQANPDGSYSPKGRLKVGGVVLGPGLHFSPGKPLFGINIDQYAGHDLDVKHYADGSIEIKGAL